MSFFLDIQNILDSRLDSLAGSTPIAWENTNYTPVEGTAFIRPTLLMSPSELMDLQDLQLNQGIYQIDLFYPLGDGPGTALAKLDAIYSHFKDQKTLTSGSTSVYIKSISKSESIREEAWYKVTLEINFKTYLP